jgi:hypothetical protein
MKNNFENNDNTFSLNNLDNYNKNINNPCLEILKKYCELIVKFFKLIFESLKIKKNNFLKFIVIRGFETITNVFTSLLFYTKNLDLTYYHTEKSYYYYVEFIQQITEEQHVFLQLSSRDACTYVYKKNIFEILPDVIKNLQQPSKELKSKLDLINKYINIYQFIFESALEKINFENEFEFINKINDIFENVYLLKLDCETSDIFFKSLQLISNFDKKNDISLDLYVEIINSLLQKCSKNTNKVFSQIKKNINKMDLELMRSNELVSGLIIPK